MTRPRLLPLLALCCIGTATLPAVPAPHDTAIRTPQQAQQALLRNAQQWLARNRPDLAREHIEKLLLQDPQSEWGLAMLGSIALHDRQPEEARRILQQLQRQSPDSAAAAQLQQLERLFQPEVQQQLARMRLLAQAGRHREAAQLAQTIFADGVPGLGNFALEYFQILSRAPDDGKTDLDRQLRDAWEKTGDDQYQYLLIERQLRRGAPSPQLLRQIQALAQRAPHGDKAIQALWRWAIQKLSWSRTPAAARAFLQQYPQDEEMREHLQQAEAALAQIRRQEQSPLNVAKRQAEQALEQDDLDLAQSRLEQAARIAPDDPDVLGNLGIVQLRRGNHAQARQQFEAAYARSAARRWQQLADTAAFWGALRQGQAALDADRITDAWQALETALSIDAAHPQALTLQARIAQAQGQPDAAYRSYEQALAQQPLYLPALREYVQLLLAQQHTAEAAALLQRHAAAADAAQRPALQALQAEVLQAQALAHLDAGRSDQALQPLEQAVQLHPDVPWTRLRLARLYDSLGRREQAERVMDEGVALHPQEPDMRHARALLLSSWDQWDKALQDLHSVPPTQRSDSMRALLQQLQLRSLLAQAQQAPQAQRQRLHAQALEQALQATEPEQVATLAGIWLQTGLPQQALALWRRLDTAQLPPPLQLGYARALHQAGQDDALQPLLAQLRALPASTWSSAERAQLLELHEAAALARIEALMDKGQTARARELALHAPLPDTDGSAAAARGRLLMAAEDWKAALPLLQKALDAAPSDFMLQVDTGNALARLGRLEQAQAMAAQAQQHAAQQAPWQQLALVRLWQRAGMPQRAHALLDALEHSPQAHSERDDILLHRARLQHAQGQYALAAHTFNTALQLPALQQSAPRLAAVQEEVQHIEARRQAWLEAGLVRIGKSGTAGISQLQGWEAPMAAWMPRHDYGGHYFLHADRVQLSAGRLQPVTGGDFDTMPYAQREFAEFGQIAARISAALPHEKGWGPWNQSARGWNTGIGFNGDRIRWDLGLIGLHMPVTNVVGGISYQPAQADSPWTLSASRRPVTGSLLSYAGARDPATGKVWGGVVLNSVTAQWSQSAGPWDRSVSVSLGVLTGRHVARNTRQQIRLSAGRTVWRSKTQSLYASAALQMLNYSKDLSHYSWGHGGYYSPRQHLALSFPVEWSGRQGPWTWSLRLSASLSYSTATQSALYPRATDYLPHLPAGLQRSYYRSDGGMGSGWSFNLLLERQLNRHLAVGMQFAGDRAESYTPNHFMLYARLLLDPVIAPPANHPRPVRSYSSF